MILVDTSVWVEHLRSGLPKLALLLDEERVAVHSFVIGELACGNLKNRDEILHLLTALPEAARVGDAEVLEMIERRRLMGQGLGWVDMHLLASALICTLGIWSLDRRLDDVAGKLGLGA